MIRDDTYLPILLSPKLIKNSHTSFVELNSVSLCIKIFKSEFPFNNNNILLILSDSFSITTAYDIFIALSKYKSSSKKNIICYTSIIDISTALIMSICDLKYATPLQGPLFIGINNIHFDVNEKLKDLFNLNVTGFYGKEKLGPNYFFENLNDNESRFYNKDTVEKINNQLFDLINNSVGKNIFKKNWYASSEELQEISFLDKTLYLEELFTIIKIKKIKIFDRIFALVSRFNLVRRKDKIYILEYKQIATNSLLFSENTFLTSLKKVRKKNPKIVIFLLDNNGGDFSDAHYYAYFLEKKLSKCQIIIYASRALSSGYFFACHSNNIVVNKFSRIGSIGNYSINMDFTQLINNLGIGVKFKPNNYSFVSKFFSIGNRKEYLEQLEIKNSICSQIFCQTILQRRPINEIDKVKQGSIFIGKESVTIGLADNELSMFEMFEKIDNTRNHEFVFMQNPQKPIIKLFEFFKRLLK